VLDPGTLLCKPVIAARKCCGRLQEIRNHPGAREKKQMAHNHGNEYQVRIIHADGTENVSGWMNSEELLQVTATVHKAQGTAYWLRERNVLCPDCFDKEQTIILECPITDIPSPRYCPHDSHYLVAVGSRDRYG
jgi:hypothetical protein